MKAPHFYYRPLRLILYFGILGSLFAISISLFVLDEVSFTVRPHTSSSMYKAELSKFSHATVFTRGELSVKDPTIMVRMLTTKKSFIEGALESVFWFLFCVGLLRLINTLAQGYEFKKQAASTLRFTG